MSHHFKIGDRVVFAENSPIHNPDIFIGSEGIICEVFYRSVGVRWDQKVYAGHDCFGRCESGYGWRVFDNQVRLVTDEYVEINEDNFDRIICGE